MNVENIDKLIEATKAYKGFAYQNCGRCFLAVLRDMKVPFPFEVWLGVPFSVYSELVFSDARDGIDKAHALRTLEHLKATGTVDWAATT